MQENGQTLTNEVIAEEGKRHMRLLGQPEFQHWFSSLFMQYTRRPDDRSFLSLVRYISAVQDGAWRYYKLDSHFGATQDIPLGMSVRDDEPLFETTDTKELLDRGAIIAAQLCLEHTSDIVRLAAEEVFLKKYSAALGFHAIVVWRNFELARHPEIDQASTQSSQDVSGGLIRARFPKKSSF